MRSTGTRRRGALEREAKYRLGTRNGYDAPLKNSLRSAVFLPLTLIAGIYGMNFQYMPALDEHYAYFLVLGLMLVIGAGMLGFFYLKGWFK